MTKNINSMYYRVEERGHLYIYHWVTFMLGGLRHIKTDAKPVKIFFEKPIQNQGYHQESLDLIKDEYVVEEPPAGSVIINNFGEPVNWDYVDPQTYVFLRNLFLSKVELPAFDEKKYIYITRKNSEHRNPANAGVMKRQILNEDTFIPELVKMGFQIIQLEDYSFVEKIKLFYSSKLIISPNSGGLTMSMFANEKTHIVELMADNKSRYKWYKNMCVTFNIDYQRYGNMEVIGDSIDYDNGIWNFMMDKAHFIDWVKHTYKL
jgi:hypothetical protein